MMKNYNKLQLNQLNELNQLNNSYESNIVNDTIELDIIDLISDLNSSDDNISNISNNDDSNVNNDNNVNVNVNNNVIVNADNVDGNMNVNDDLIFVNIDANKKKKKKSHAVWEDVEKQMKQIFEDIGIKNARFDKTKSDNPNQCYTKVRFRFQKKNHKYMIRYGHSAQLDEPAKRFCVINGIKYLFRVQVLNGEITKIHFSDVEKYIYWKKLFVERKKRKNRVDIQISKKDVAKSQNFSGDMNELRNIIIKIGDNTLNKNDYSKPLVVEYYNNIKYQTCFWKNNGMNQSNYIA
jgi:hypothetical protein